MGKVLQPAVVPWQAAADSTVDDFVTAMLPELEKLKPVPRFQICVWKVKFITLFQSQLLPDDRSHAHFSPVPWTVVEWCKKI
jgi:hypothetical protein